MAKNNGLNESDSKCLVRLLADSDVALPSTILKKLIDAAHTVSYDEGETILRHGDKADRLWIVAQGLCRVYYQTPDGTEYTRALVAESRPLGAYSNALRGEPSDVFIETLEDTRLIEIPYTSLQVLFEADRAFEKLGRKVVEYFFIMREKREAQMVLLSAKEKYQAFVRDFPELSNRVNKGIIANFLGMKPETLSRVLSSKQ